MKKNKKISVNAQLNEAAQPDLAKIRKTTKRLVLIGIMATMGLIIFVALFGSVLFRWTRSNLKKRRRYGLQSAG